MKLWSWKMLQNARRKARQKAQKSRWLEGLTTEQQTTLTANLRRMLEPERPPGRVVDGVTNRVTNRVVDRVIDRPQQTAANLR